MHKSQLIQEMERFGSQPDERPTGVWRKARKGSIAGNTTGQNDTVKVALTSDSELMLK